MKERNRQGALTMTPITNPIHAGFGKDMRFQWKQPNAGIDRRERKASNTKETKEHEKHAIERPCRMTYWAAHKWNEPYSLCLSR